MATGLLAAAANTGLDAVLANYTWVKLHVGDPGAAGTSSPATETTRKQATWRASASGASSQSNALTWTNVAGTEDFTHFSVMTASTAGSVGFTGTITANAVVAGDTFTIAVDDLDAALTLAS
jgi:hypothetical protein